MKIVKQSLDYSCGPAVVSMISSIPEKVIIQILGDRFTKGAGVKPKNLLWVLKTLNIDTSKWLKDGLWPWSEKAILRYGFYKNHHPNRIEYGHYLVYYKKKFYDPYWGIRKDFFHWSHSGEWIKVTGYLDVYK